jgi:phage terminase Nu1 subunit (DNA packaging protein)
MNTKQILVRRFSATTLSQLMGVSIERIQELTANKILEVDESGKYNLVEANRAYLRYKIKQYRVEIIDAAAQLTLERVGMTKAKRMQAELLLAKAREEVIEVELVKRQAAFLFVAMRQKLLAMPVSIARKLLHQSDIKPVVNLLTEAVHRALRELKEFPKLVIDPNWTGEEDEDKKQP